MQVNDLSEELLQLVFKIVANTWAFSVWPKDPYCSDCAKISILSTGTASQRNLKLTPSCAKCVAAHERPHLERLGWVSLTFVCSHWRRIIVGCPTFWTEIYDPMTSDCVQAFLERSKNQGLDVSDKRPWHRSHGPNGPRVVPPSPAFVQTLVAAHDRIHRLSVHRPVVYGLAHEFAARPLSSLKALCLTTYDNCTPSFSQEDRVDILSLVESTFSNFNRAPSSFQENRVDILSLLKPCHLQTLDLRVSVQLSDWALPAYSNLRTLSLHNLRAPPGVLPSLFACIRSLKDLRYLRISSIMELTDENALELASERPILLHCCKELDIEGRRGCMTALLNIIRVHSNARIKIHGRFVEHESPQRSDALFAKISRADYIVNGDPGTEIAWASFDHIRASIGAGPIPMATLHDRHWHDRWLLRTSHMQSVFENTSSSVDTNYDHELRFHWITESRNGYSEEAFTENCFAVFTAAASIAPHVRDLRFPARILSGSAITPNVLRRCFASWTSVERISAAGTKHAHTVVSALEPPSRGSAPLFPQLAELILVDAGYNEERFGKRDMPWAQIMRMLIERHKVGVPLKVLRLSDVEMLKQEAMWWKLISRMVLVQPLYA
ncbi:hypothetical protein PENSPDRAFT_751773 [Peniophora sp. CONT]|nr:hypothetical protein PENSPDRAFT_751773 [Peniophora sp. CONT]